MKELVLNKKLDEKISVEQNTFIRDKSTWSIRTEVINKLYRLVYDKRILLEDFSISSINSIFSINSNAKFYKNKSLQNKKKIIV